MKSHFKYLSIITVFSILSSSNVARAQFMAEWNSDDDYFNVSNEEINTLTLTTDSGFYCYTIKSDVNATSTSNIAYVQHIGHDGSVQERSGIDFRSLDTDSMGLWNAFGSRFFEHGDGEVFTFWTSENTNCDSILAIKLNGSSVSEAIPIYFTSNGLATIMGYTQWKGNHILAGATCSNQLQIVAFDSSWVRLWSINNLNIAAGPENTLFDFRVDIKETEGVLVLHQIELAMDRSKVFLIDTNLKVTEWMPENEFVHRQYIPSSKRTVSWTKEKRSSPLIMTIHDEEQITLSRDTLNVPSNFEEVFPILSFDTDSGYGAIMDRGVGGSPDFLVYLWGSEGEIKTRSSYSFEKKDWYPDAASWINFVGTRKVDGENCFWGSTTYSIVRRKASDIKRSDGFLFTLSENEEPDNLERNVLSDRLKYSNTQFMLAPNPTADRHVFLIGKDLTKVVKVTMTDMTGKSRTIPFDSRNGKIEVIGTGINVLTLHLSDGSLLRYRLVSI